MFGERVFKTTAHSAFQVLFHQSTCWAGSCSSSQMMQSCPDHTSPAAPANSEPSSPKQSFYFLLHFYFKFKRRNTGRKWNLDGCWCYFRHLPFLFFCGLGLPHAPGNRCRQEIHCRCNRALLCPRHVSPQDSIYNKAIYKDVKIITQLHL